MCDTCTLLQLDRCPPTNPAADPDVAEQIAFETEIEALRPPTSGRPVVDATAELVLRAQLGPRVSEEADDGTARDV